MAKPVTLDIYEGEQVAILGPNGSGKTRLVEILTGRWPLLYGNEVRYDFGDANNRLVSENIKVMTFRDSYGDADTTYYLQKRWNQHDIDEDTPMVNGQPLISLSSGELRKYQLQRALLSHPRLLILDNPFIGLDTEARQQLRDTLEQLIREEGLQVVLVVSRKKDIPDFITNVIEMKDGKLENEKYTLPESAEEQSCLTDNRKTNSSLSTPSPFTHTILVCADNPQAYACDIELFGRRRGTGESIWDIKRHIGYVSPEMHRAYLKDLPAIDIVASGLHDSVGLYVRPRPEQRAQCVAWMQRFGIAELADRPFLQLSSGEQRLCLLTRAFVKEPDLLILDEPFHGLDDERRLLATHIIEDYCQKPEVTLIIVSHYAEELPHGITHSLELKKPC